MSVSGSFLHERSQYRSGLAYYYDVDGLGSVNLANDASGTVQDKYLYDGWGITRSSTTPIANPFVYTARESGEAGLLFYRARYYNPNIGRFVSEDPLRNNFLGAAEIISGLDSENFYVYVESQPTKLVDPYGLYGILGPPTSDELDAVCATSIAIAAAKNMKTRGPRFAHCWASCEITKRCTSTGNGKALAEQAGNFKEEVIDLHLCKWGYDKACSSYKQPCDYTDNEFGRNCPKKQNCKDRCKDLPREDCPPGPGVK